ncbi:Arginase/deacetylase [Zopfia rhizophila CBS 207.26]|uniref:agmatinase n=1 Tax=Zopfia rhizophila CBS 207.26 TaxID=1314779 RepID=A0A6A6ECS3_9PEZI|nr:Arginase/deacetylase [Zopfia rhizophila CBS 207.26]
MLLPRISILSSLQVLALAQSTHPVEDQQPFSQAHLEELERKWGIDWGFSGIPTFAHLPHIRCLTQPETTYDIGILGAPFDTAVSYRPGARFGPRAIRAGSSRQTSFRGFNPRANLNPYTSWAKIVDCGDIPITPFDNALALRQMSEAYKELGHRLPTTESLDSSTSFLHKPKLLTLGGDHSIALPALRALKEVYGQPIAVVHFDAHLDTWHPAKYPSAWIDPTAISTQSFFNHGSMFWIASTEGLIANGSSVHAGLRTRLSGDDTVDFADDNQQGWIRISTDDIDEIGVKGVITSIMERVGTETPVYLSIDIDVIDPGLAPGTGTPEPGGWTTREVIRILRGIEGLNVVGADIVEVSPAYDGSSEVTGLAAAQLAYEVLTSIVRKGLIEQAKVGKGGKKHLAPHHSTAFQGYYSKFGLPSGAHLALIICTVPNATERPPHMVTFTYYPASGPPIYQ